MNGWIAAVLVAVLIFIASRGGLPILFALAKVLMPVALFFIAVKYITQLVFPDSKPKANLPNEQDPQVIRICGSCGREENSCIKCKLGFAKKNL